MATLTVQDINHTGVEPTFVAVAAGGDQFANDGRIFVYFKNSNVATRTVTTNSQVDCSQGFDHDIAVVIPVTPGERMIGPFPANRFNDSSGNLQLTYDADAGLTVSVLRLVANP